MNEIKNYILTNWGGYNVKPNVEETDDEIKLMVLYEDHGDKFILIRTKEGNTYELIPGLTYVKAPTITVLAGSDSCYVFFAISIDDEIANVLDKSKNVIATQLQANGWLELQDSNKVQIVWTYKGGRAFNVYYKADAVPASSVDQTLATFEKFSVAEGATYDDLRKVVCARITTQAFAVWSDAFDTPQAAWDGTFKQVSG